MAPNPARRAALTLTLKRASERARNVSLEKAFNMNSRLSNCHDGDATPTSDGKEGTTLSDPRTMTVLHYRRPPRPFFALSLLFIIFAVIRDGRVSSDYVSDNGSKHLIVPSSCAHSCHTGNEYTRPVVGCHLTSGVKWT